MAKDTELEGVAELVRIAPAAADCDEIGSVQRPVPNKVLFDRGQGEQLFELRFGERAASRHGGVPVRV
jgi:hypothetical protein